MHHFSFNRSRWVKDPARFLSFEKVYSDRFNGHSTFSFVLDCSRIANNLR
jgi:hypothetical protein